MASVAAAGEAEAAGALVGFRIARRQVGEAVFVAEAGPGLAAHLYLASAPGGTREAEAEAAAR